LLSESTSTSGAAFGGGEYGRRVLAPAGHGGGIAAVEVCHILPSVMPAMPPMMVRGAELVVLADFTPRPLPSEAECSFRIKAQELFLLRSRQAVFQDISTSTPMAFTVPSGSGGVARHAPGGDAGHAVFAS
jgi:hypothetical protein